MSPRRWRTSICPECGATLAIGATDCWLCRLKLELDATAAAHAQAPSADGAADAAEAPLRAGSPPSAGSERRAAFQFSLSTLMLTVTVVAVLLGVISMSPGFGIVLAILVTPAWLRTCVIASRKEARGRPMSGEQRLEVFVASVGVVLIAGIAAGAAFFVTCFAGFWGGAAAASSFARGYEPIGWGFVTGIALGAIVGLWVLYLLLRRFWKRKH